MPVKARHDFTIEIQCAIKVAVEEFGEYTYQDKGPTEVMDTEPLMAKFEKLSEADQQRVCRELRKSKHGDTFVEYMLGDYEQRPGPAAPPKAVKISRLPDFLGPR